MAAEKVQLGYSAKNIPLSSKWSYRQALINKTKLFLRNCTVRATFFLKKSKPNTKDTFGFKSSWEPGRLPELKEFENSLLDLVQNVEFHGPQNHGSQFQRNLRSDINKIKSDQNIHVKGDKTKNYYQMTKDRYPKYRKVKKNDPSLRQQS